MSKETIARVHYFERQFLRTEDFSDEQSYHLAMRRRHNIAHHSWGIVYGLALTVDSLGNPAVQAGVAVDGYGRELILPEQQPLPLNAFVDKDSDLLDVWLEYDRLGSESPGQGYVDCGADPSQSPYRWEEKPLLRLTVPDPARTDRRKPEAVARGDLAFTPNRPPPDEPQQDWPVFLGQVERTRPKPGKPYVYSFDLDGRPYTGLVGEAVSAPSGRARVRIGAEKEADPYRFAVFVPNAGPASDDPPRLGIDKDGKVEIQGETSLHGDLTMKGGAVEFSVGTAIDPPVSETAAPWRIYRVKKTEGEVGQDKTTHQLRIEMDTGNDAENEVVVGAWSEEEKKFVPCLTVNDECGVIVHGNLVVKGLIDEPQKRAIRQTGITAKQSEIAATLSALPGAAEPFNAFYFNYLAAVRAKEYLPYALTTPAYRKAMLDEMKDNPKIFDLVAAEIKKDPDLLDMAMTAFES
jgi:hypothetical protein